MSVVGQFFNAVNGFDDRGLVLDLSSGRSLDERLGRGPPIAKHGKTAPICCPKREEDGSGRQPVWPSGVDSKAIEDIRKKRVKKRKKVGRFAGRRFKKELTVVNCFAAPKLRLWRRAIEQGNRKNVE